MIPGKYREFVAYLSLLLYFILLASLCSGSTINILLVTIFADTLVFFLYRFIEDEILLYLHIFVAMSMAMVPYLFRERIYLADIGFLYLALFPLFLHFVLLRFRSYEKIHTLTYLYYLSSLPLSFITIFLLLYFPMKLGVLALSFLILLLLGIYHFLSKPNL